MGFAGAADGDDLPAAVLFCPEPPVRARLSALADDDDVGVRRRHLPFAVFEYARGLRDRAAALQGQPLCRPWDLSRLSGAAIDPVHSAGDGGGPVRTVRQSLGADPGLSDLPGAVLHLAAD